MKKSHLLFIFIYSLYSIGWGQVEIKKTSFTNYKLNTNQCLGLVYHTGSQIYIPEGAFGDIPNKKVTIKYREFHDKVDIILNDIPMLTDKGEQLESGGMFEIQAEYKGKPIELAEGKEITVRMAGLKNTNNLDSYFFDKVKKVWKKIKNKFTDIPVKAPENDDELWGGDAGVEGTGEDFFDGEENWEFDDWCEGCPDEMDSWKEYDSVRFEVFKSMGISEMGLYNYDKVFAQETAVPMKAKFSVTGDTAKILTAYVVYDGINSVISYGRTPYSFNLLVRDDIRIFAILNNGKVANVDPKVIKGLNIIALKDKEFTFEFISEAKKPTTGEELATLTNITR